MKNETNFTINMLCLNALKRKISVLNLNMKFSPYQSYRKIRDVTFENNPMTVVSSALIKKQFKEKKLNHEEGFTCFIIKCIFCGSTKKSNLYVNKTTGMLQTKAIYISFYFQFSGFFMCSCCKKSGNWDTLNSFLNSNKPVKKLKQKDQVVEQVASQELETLTNVLTQIGDTTIQIHSLMENEVTDILRHFNFPVSIISQYGIILSSKKKDVLVIINCEITRINDISKVTILKQLYKEKCYIVNILKNKAIDLFKTRKNCLPFKF